MGLGSFLSRTARQTGNVFGDVGEGIGDAWNDVTGKTAARTAANAQVASAKEATDFQREALKQQTALNDPWREAGISALGDLATGLRSGQFEAPQEDFSYNMPDTAFNFNFEADPGYQFRQQQQQQAVERSAAARGGLFSEATLSDLVSRSGQIASDEYGQAFNRAYTQNRSSVADAQNKRNFAYGNFTDAQNRKRLGLQDRFARLSSLAGLGEAATSRIGQAQSTFGQQAGDNAIGAGNAKAAGLVGGYNTQRDTLMGLGELGLKGAGLFTGGSK